MTPTPTKKTTMIISRHYAEVNDFDEARLAEILLRWAMQTKEEGK
jgi:hypothetical protein